MVFNELYFCEFLSYTSNQVVKKYLLAQENSLACTMWARARLRARCAAVKMGEKMRFFFAIFTIAMCRGALFSRVTARTPKWCAPMDSPDQGDNF